MPTQVIRTTRTSESIKITNSRFSFEVSISDGTLAQLIEKKSGRDLCPGKRIGITVTDELKERTYSDLRDPVKVKKINVSGKGPERLISIRKTIGKADFEVHTFIRVGKDNFLWTVKLVKKRGRERSARISFVLGMPTFPRHDPNIGGLKAWRVWAPVADAPFNVSGFSTPGSIIFSHGKALDGSDEIPIPAIVVYDPDEDVGMTLAKPFEEINPRVHFFLDQRNGDIEIENLYVGLRNDHNPSVSLYLAIHEGDWRAGLGWIFRRYREYFTPQDKRIFDQEGVMHYGKLLSEKRVEQWARLMGFKWQETPYFRDALAWGPNLPSKDPFDAVWPDIPEIQVKGMTIKKCNDYLRMLRRHGVSAFIYHNSGDYNRRLAEEKFPESIVVLRNGRQHPGWRSDDPTATPEARGCMMNPDPDLPYGRMILEEVKKSFELFPGLAGVFVDQCCYSHFDYSKDDGRTMVDNRRCQFTLHSYLRLHEKLWAFLKARGKTTFANGPFCPAIQKHMDGIMAEGTFEQLAFLTLAKPLVLLQVGEPAFKWCLKYGAFPHVAPLGRDLETFHLNEAPLPKDLINIYRTYLPLVEFMRGKRWVLTPHALTLPEEHEGNIFETKDGNYIVTVMSTERSILDNKKRRETVPVRIRVRGGKRIRRAELLSVDFPGARRVELARKGKDIFLSVPRFMTAGVVHLIKQ